MTLTYCRGGKVISVRVPKDATPTNGPLIPLWDEYDALGRPSRMVQDSWGRAVSA